MGDTKEAYKLPIEDGKVRVVINIENINVEITNNAEKFITAEDDKKCLFLSIDNLNISAIKPSGYELITQSGKKSDESFLSLKKDSIWFDVNMDDMSNVLTNTIQFSIIGDYPTHLTYFIKKLDYKIEWLQYDSKKDSISTVSVTKRSFVESRKESAVGYSIDDISKSAELLGRAIKKIDLRTGSSYVRINTEDGTLNPILVTIAEKLGYQLEVLDKEQIESLQEEGRKATHIISLILNY